MSLDTDQYLVNLLTGRRINEIIGKFNLGYGLRSCRHEILILSALLLCSRVQI